LIVGALRHALAGAGHRASTTVSAQTLGALRPAGTGGGGAHPLSFGAPGGAAALAEYYAPLPGIGAPSAPPGGTGLAEEPAPYEAAPQQDFPLGVARAQLHETYVVAQTGDGIVIVDQHAAHERLVYERMKEALAAGGVARQG